MKPKLVIGNWKMNKTFEEADDLIIEISELLEGLTLQTGVILCPPLLYLELTTDHAEENEFSAGAQNCSEFPNGAYTGEISTEMLAAIGVEFCIVGHSERRKYFNESNQTVAKKVDRLLHNEIIPIVCCGELLDDRKNGEQFAVVEKQIQESLFHLTKDQMETIVIAYEPVWAIGTGETATPAQAEEMHQFIRQLIEKKYGTEVAYNTYIVYGGSCNAQNALELFAQSNIDGGLIGGASLKAKDFYEIIEAAETSLKDN
jgi:triosephosphate isomerase (TIM)